MKLKFVYIALFTFFTALVCYTFATSTVKSGYEKYKYRHYSSLSPEEKSQLKEMLVTDLKKDSIFLMYEMVSNIQREALYSVPFSPANLKKFKALPSVQSVTGLTDRYRALGIEKPEQFAKVEMLKCTLLAGLAKRYPELNQMDSKTRMEIFKSSKKPLTASQIAKRNALVQKTFEKQQLSH